MNKKTTSISSNVLGQIKAGKIKMRPSIYFTLVSLGIILASLMSGLVIAYSSSVIFFWLKIISAENAAYGAKRNLIEQISSFPIWTIAVLAISIVFLAYLIHKHGTAYRHRIVNILLIILALALISGFIMSLFGVGKLDHGNFGGARDYRQNNSDLNR